MLLDFETSLMLAVAGLAMNLGIIVLVKTNIR